MVAGLGPEGAVVGLGGLLVVVAVWVARLAEAAPGRQCIEGARPGPVPVVEPITGGSR
jgi:hypothetical protein